MSQKLKIATLDFETFYDKEYTLSKLTTAEYVHSPLFEIIGVAVKINNDPIKWFSGTLEDTILFLKSFDLENCIVVAHNALFDGYILEKICGIKPKGYFCTYQAATAISKPYCGSASLKATAEYYKLPPKGGYVVLALGKRRNMFTPSELSAYADYCIHDVELCYALLAKFWLVLSSKDRRIIDLTIRKFTRGVIELDQTLLEDALDEVQTNKAKLLLQAGVGKSQLTSNDKFAEVLRRHGVIPPMKTSLRTGKRTYAFAKTDASMRELQNHPDPLVQAIVAARLGHKSTIEETRIERFISLAKLNQPLGVPTLAFGARTWRSAALDGINLLNIPKKGKLRQAMIAPSGYKLVVGDESQVEARINATLAGQSNIVEAFRNGEDVYSQVATAIYGYKVTEETHPEERFVGKIAVLALGYGMGSWKYQQTLAAWGVMVNDTEAYRIVEAYREANPMIVKLWKRAEQLLESMVNGERFQLGPVITGDRKLFLPGGRTLYYPELYKDASKEWWYKRGKEFVKIYSAKLVENIVQALAAIIVTDAEAYLDERGYQSALQVYDEIVYAVEVQVADKFATVLEKVMTRPVEWLPKLPLAAGVKIGDKYSECK